MDSSLKIDYETFVQYFNAYFACCRLLSCAERRWARWVL